MHNILKIHFYDLAVYLANDLGLDPRSTSYLLRRVRCEGLSFLTKTLPKLSKAVLRSLETGCFKSNRPTQFKWKGASLEFCSVWLSKIFDHEGKLLKDSCPYAIKSIRQLCEYFYKFTLPFSEEDLKNAELKYLKTESDMESNELDRVWLDHVRGVFETLYPAISSTTVDGVFKASSPRFGPGAFSGSTKVALSTQVYKNRPDSEIGTTCTSYAAMSGYFKPYPSAKTRISTVKEDKTSEVVFVPKDSRGPRVISKEPMHLLRGQMAFFDWLSGSLEKDSKRRINFKDQALNRKLARMSSVSRKYATLDLESASDLMQFKLANSVFRNSPALRWFINNARSTHTKLPVSGKTISLRKLSGMGSGITFPVMALLIQVSIIASVRFTNPHLSIKQISKQVYVYGDDIIVPTMWYNCAVRGLESSGFKCNSDKSFYRGFFRESCGGDYYNGVDVGPVRFKMSNNGVKSVKRGVISSLVFNGDGATLQLERHCRELVKNNMPTLSTYLYKVLNKHLGGTLVHVSGNSPCLGIWSYKPEPARFEQTQAYVPVPVTVRDDRTCPYKYLSRFFKLSCESEWNGVYGFLAEPRNVKLKRQLVTYLQTVQTDVDSSP